jgi:5-methylcytosine-specific restriction endonuclease McrA
MSHPGCILRPHSTTWRTALHRMKFEPEVLSGIYDRTCGRCHICTKKLAFKNYGAFGELGAWEVEHSNPRANGGTHRQNNLYAACISCNRSKGKSSTRSARARHGRTKAPISVDARSHVKTENAFIGAGSGALLGAELAGPPGALLGGLLGALFGHTINPDPE